MQISYIPENATTGSYFTEELSVVMQDVYDSSDNKPETLIRMIAGVVDLIARHTKLNANDIECIVPVSIFSIEP